MPITMNARLSEQDLV